MSRLMLILPLLALALTQPQPAAAAESADVATIKACIAKTIHEPQRDCIGPLSDTCQESPDVQTTEGMNICLSREGEAWDVILNENYAAEMAAAKSLDATRKADGDETSAAAADLVKAQRAWIAYRDAECDRRFEVDKDGTFRVASQLTCVLDLTALRALDLHPMER